MVQMEANSKKQSSLEHSPNRLKRSVWEYFEFYTTDDKVRIRLFVDIVNTVVLYIHVN